MRPASIVTWLLIILNALLLAQPALAQGWGTYANVRYGATADVPPGFEPIGAEAKNSDGLIYRARSGAVLTIFGADVPGKDFEAKVKDMMAFDTSYHGWTIAGSTVTNDWAEYSGNAGGRQLRVRIEASCGGRQLVAVKLEFNGNQGATLSRLFASLEAGPASSC